MPTGKLFGLRKFDLIQTSKGIGFVKGKRSSGYFAISDIHGQHELFIKLLQSQKVINEENQWIYDKGHLVIVGDIFDRGDQVTETLWFLFFLEKVSFFSIAII